MDSKRININEQFKLLLARRDILVYIIMAVITLFAAMKFHSFQTQKINEAKDRIIEENKKNDLISSMGKIEQEIMPYQIFFSKKEQLEIINDISNIARQEGIKISSIQPLAPSKEGRFTKIAFSLSLEATYHMLGKFISKLEKLPAFFRVENLRLPQQEALSARGSRGGGYELPKEDNILTVSLTLSILYIE